MMRLLRVPPTYIILMTGQSNGNGTGGKIDKTYGRDDVDERILMWDHRRLEWVLADLECDMGTKRRNDQCLAFHFAKEFIRDHPWDTVGIIVHCCNGASIASWDQTRCGDVFRETMKVSQEALKVIGRSCIDCILWHQGESDHFGSHALYGASLKRVIEDYRNIFGNRVMFICGELKMGGLDKQNSVLNSISTEASNAGCARNKHFPCTDGIHFNSESLRNMGSRYYRVYLGIVNKCILSRIKCYM